MNAIKRIFLFGLVGTTILLAGCEGTYLTGAYVAAPYSGPYYGAGDHTAAATLSLAEIITTTTTDTTISTATTLVSIIFTAADSTAVDSTAVAIGRIGKIGRDELLLIRR